MRHDIDYAHEWRKAESRARRDWWIENVAIVVSFVMAAGFAIVTYIYC